VNDRDFEFSFFGVIGFVGDSSSLSDGLVVKAALSLFGSFAEFVPDLLGPTVAEIVVLSRCRKEPENIAPVKTNKPITLATTMARLFPLVDSP